MAAMVVHFMWSVLFVLATELRDASSSPLPVDQGLIRSPPLPTGDTIALGRYDQHGRQNAIHKWDRPDSFNTMQLSQSHRQKRKYTMTHSPVPHARIPSIQSLEKVPAAIEPLRNLQTQSETSRDGTEVSRNLATGKSVKQRAEASRMKYEKHTPLIVIKENKLVPSEKQGVDRKAPHKYHLKNVLASIMEISKALDNIATVLRNAKQRLNGTKDIDRLLNKYIGIILNAYGQPQGLSTVYMPSKQGPYKHVTSRAIGNHTPMTIKEALEHMIGVAEREKGHIPRNLSPYQKIMAKYAIKQKQMRSILAFIVNPYLLRPTQPLSKKTTSNPIRAQTKPTPPVLTPPRRTSTPRRFRNQLVSFGNPSLAPSQHSNLRNLINQAPLAAPVAKVNQNQTPTSANIKEQKQRPSTAAVVQSSSAKQPARIIKPRSTQRPQSNSGTRQFQQGQTSPVRSSSGRISQNPPSRQAPTPRRSADQKAPTQGQNGNRRALPRSGVQKKTSQNSKRQHFGTRQSSSTSRLNRQTPNTSPKAARQQTSNQRSNFVGSSSSGKRREVNSPANRVVASSRQTSRRGNTNTHPNGFASSNNRQSNQTEQNLQMNKPRMLPHNDPLLQSNALRGTKDLKSHFQSSQQRHSPGNSIRQKNPKPRQANIPFQQTHVRTKSIPVYHEEQNPRKQVPSINSRQQPSTQRQTSAHPQTPSRVRQFDTVKPSKSKLNQEIRQNKPSDRGINQRGQNSDPSQVFGSQRVRSAPLEKVLIRNHHPKNGKKVDISIALGGQSGFSLTMQDPSQP